MKFSIGIIDSGAPPAPAVPLSFLEMIEADGLDTSLDFCLDAAAADSYDGSAQTWSDLTNSNDFFLGATSGAEASDPTFNGSAGSLTASEYFSLDGGDFFKEASDLAFAENWHKDGATFTLAGVFNISITNVATLFATNSSGGPGISWLRSVNAMGLRVRGNSGSSVLLTNAVTGLTAGWHFLAMSVSENAGASGGIGRRDATEATFNPAYSSPSTSGTAGVYTLMGLNGAAGQDVGECLACLAGWSRALSSAELGQLYARVKARFTSLP